MHKEYHIKQLTFLIKYSSLTNKELYPKRWPLKREESSTNHSAFSRTLGSEAAARYWMTVRGTVRPAAWPSRSETGGTRERDEWGVAESVLHERQAYNFYYSLKKIFAPSLIFLDTIGQRVTESNTSLQSGSIDSVQNREAELHDFEAQ